MKKILWVDDDLNRDLTRPRMVLLMQDDIDLDLASNASEAYDCLLDNTYDCVLLDLQHPPGLYDMWNSFRDKGERKYGLVLLKMVRENREGKFSHLSDTRFGVLTIETWEENKEALQAAPIFLPVDNFMSKSKDNLEEDKLLDFINNLKEFSQNDNT